MYLQAIFGVLAYAWCPEGFSILGSGDLDLELLKLFESFFPENTTTGNITDLPASGTHVIDYSDDLTVPNSTVSTKRQAEGYVDMVNKYCDSMFQSEYHKTVYIGMSISFSMLIFIGNILVLILPSISKAFRSPIFSTVLSFSFISLIRGIDLLFYSLAQCSLMFSFILKSGFECIIFSCVKGFIANVISLHLCLLACQRIYLSLFPFKAHVNHTKTNVRRCILCIYISCVLIELIMGVQGSRDCVVSAYGNDVSTIFKTNADFIVFNLIVVVLLSAGMLSGIVQRYVSPRLTQSASQRTQSRIASIVIVLYLIFYCPFKIVGLVLQFTCADPTYVVPIAVTASTAQFMIGALNPIILCLRVPEAKRALKDSCFSCIANHQKNRT
ncbi:OLFR [Mytilus coruscus]|uniref:OLFR n=1 Tax=Mytilus coruscus TaxID=42192 RepID=A0A6J8EXE7_MYTCO|nr:OLFR [Mytilus coruscus]